MLTYINRASEYVLSLICNDSKYIIVYIRGYWRFSGLFRVCKEHGDIATYSWEENHITFHLNISSKLDCKFSLNVDNSTVFHIYTGPVFGMYPVISEENKDRSVIRDNTYTQFKTPDFRLHQKHYSQRKREYETGPCRGHTGFWHPSKLKQNLSRGIRVTSLLEEERRSRDVARIVNVNFDKLFAEAKEVPLDHIILDLDETIIKEEIIDIDAWKSKRIDETLSKLFAPGVKNPQEKAKIDRSLTYIQEDLKEVLSSFDRKFHTHGEQYSDSPSVGIVKEYSPKCTTLIEGIGHNTIVHEKLEFNSPLLDKIYQEVLKDYLEKCKSGIPIGIIPTVEVEPIISEFDMDEHKKSIESQPTTDP